MISDDYSIIEATSTADPINVPISWDFVGLTELEVTIQDNTLGTIYKYTDGDFSITLNEAGDEIDCENPLGSGNSVDVKVYRQSPKTQTYGPNENEQLDADALEAALDRAVKLNQEISKTFLDSAITSANAFEVPDKVARVGKVLTFDSSGDPDFQTTADLFAEGISHATEWANKAEDSLISTAAGGDGVDDYSALHHSAKANAQRVLAETARTGAETAETNAETAQTAAEAAQTAAETAETNAAADAASVAASASEITSLRTLSGTSSSDDDLGTFTGSTISDDVTIKTALQELETALEGNASGGFGANYQTEATAATLAADDYGSDEDKTIKWTGTSGGLTHQDSANLDTGDYVFILNATTDPLLIDFDNASDTFIATDAEDDYIDPGQVKRYEFLGSNEWRIG